MKVGNLVKIKTHHLDSFNDNLARFVYKHSLIGVITKVYRYQSQGSFICSATVMFGSKIKEVKIECLELISESR